MLEFGALLLYWNFIEHAIQCRRSTLISSFIIFFSIKKKKKKRSRMKRVNVVGIFNKSICNVYNENCAARNYICIGQWNDRNVLFFIWSSNSIFLQIKFHFLQIKFNFLEIKFNLLEIKFNYIYTSNSIFYKLNYIF